MRQITTSVRSEDRRVEESVSCATTQSRLLLTLPIATGGRFMMGIGGGWNAEEMENHGTDFKKRWHILRERVLAMKEIWTKTKQSSMANS
jgi:luciferase-like monooxygenase